MRSLRLFNEYGTPKYGKTPNPLFDCCDKDEWSMIEVKDMAEILGLDPETLNYYYKIVCGNGKEEFALLQDDTQLLSSLDKIPRNRVFSIYFENAHPEEFHTQVESNNVGFGLGTELDLDIGTELDLDLGIMEGEQAKDINLVEENHMDSHGLTEPQDFCDSDYDVDDQLVYANVDEGVEWGGLQNKKSFNGKDIGDFAFLDYEAETGEFEDKYDASDDDLKSEGSSDEETVQKYVTYSGFNKNSDMSDPKFQIGMKFGTIEEFKDAVTQHSVKHGKETKYAKSEKDRVRVVCKEGCDWVILLSKVQGKEEFQIKTYNPVHNCHRNLFNKNAKARWIAKTYLERIRSNPTMPLESLQADVWIDHTTHVSRNKCFRAKQHALKKIHGTVEEQFRRLNDYCEELRRMSPGSTVELKTNGVVFERLYICLGPLKRGFLEGCRPIIGLDGCHLKGPQGGILLTAVGIDGNNCIYPFAYAVVESENKQSWLWFLELLKNDIKMNNSFHWTFMSDKQKGLVPALEQSCPNSEHRFCVRHLYNNFKLLHKGLALKDKLWDCARASNPQFFEKCMEKLKNLNEEAFKWLHGKPPQQWSRSHFSTGPQCDILLNNLCESFNAAILEARDKPLITMLEKIRRILMRRTHVLRDKMIKCKGLLCPKIQAIIENTKIASTHCTPTWSGGPKFEVLSKEIQYVVDMDNRTCSCRRWELTGIPCAHAVSAMCFASLEVEGFVADWYKRDLYIKTYNNTVDPIHGPEMWPKTGLPPIIPPISRKRAGRPKKLRRKEPDENQAGNQDDRSADLKLHRKGGTVTCSHCKVLGHNMRFCPSNPLEVETPLEVDTEKKKKTVMCSICKNHGHNKRKCQFKTGQIHNQSQESEPAQAPNQVPFFEQVQEVHGAPEIQSQTTVQKNLVPKRNLFTDDSYSKETTSQSKKKRDEVSKQNQDRPSQHIHKSSPERSKRFMVRGGMKRNSPSKSAPNLQVNSEQANSIVGNGTMLNKIDGRPISHSVNIGKVQINPSFIKKGRGFATLGSLQTASNKKNGDMQSVVMDRNDIV